MANEDRSSTVLLQYKVDEASVSNVKRSVTSIYSDFKKLEGTVGSASDTTKNLEKAIKALEREQAIQRLAKEFVDLSKASGQSSVYLQQLQTNLKDVGASTVEISRATRAFLEFERAAESAKNTTSKSGGLNLGKIESSGSQLSRGLRGVGATGVGNLVDTGADALQSVLALKSTLAAMVPVTLAANAGFAATAVALAPVALAAGAVVLAVGGIALAFDNFTKTVAPAKTAFEAALSTQKKYYDFLASGGTSEQAKKEIENLYRIRNSAIDAQSETENALQSLEKTTNINRGFGITLPGAAGDPFRGLTKQLDENTKAIAEADAAIGRYNGGLLTNAFLMNDAAAAAEYAATVEKVRYDAIRENSNKAFMAASDAEKKQREFQDKQRGDAAAIQKKYEDQRQKIEDEGDQKELDIKQKYADKVADITKKAVDSANASLDKLNERQQSLALSATRGVEDSEIKAQREDLAQQIKLQEKERDSLVAHLRKVQEIQNSFRSEERDALLSRNFAQLFSIQESKKEQLATEDQATTQRKQDLEQEFKDQRTQTARQRQYEAQDRLRAFQRALNDANDQYQRELTLSRNAKVAALNLAQSERDAQLKIADNTRTSKLKLLYDTYVNELRYITLGAEARMAADAQVNAAYLARANAMLASLGAPTVPVSSLPPERRALPGRPAPTPYARGGDFGAGTFGMINDGYRGQRERINGMKMPPGIGLFVATGAGRVTDDGGGVQVGNVSITVNESKTPKLTQQAVYSAVLQAMAKLTRSA